tara:strand:+ start:691 stop:2220 length:1530 start_codon:yes stop_codon:yes gene_type:complete
MKSKRIFKTKNKPIMVLGTSSGVGKSITVTALCRILNNMGEKPIPFKGQNMSNNAWVDKNGGEMAYSQALQAFASRINPEVEMNPILLKPQGDSISEIIHLGKVVGTTTARNYYSDWFNKGWEVIVSSLNKISNNDINCRLIVEGAGSPVEMNLIHRDLTNLRIAKYLEANCILIADIERGGVFAQIIGTLELLKPDERNLIKGIIINRFRGDISLFSEGRKWLEDKTKIPILGILPSLENVFPPEDSLDLLERKSLHKDPEINVGIVKLPSISNFSDFDPLENEESIKLTWISKSQDLEKFDFIILPGSKQTIKDLIFLKNSGLFKNIQIYSKNEGSIFGICGGLQMLGNSLEDPLCKEGIIENYDLAVEGLGLLPINTKFIKNKITKQVRCHATWPNKTIINGFEIHNGITKLIDKKQYEEIKPIFKKENYGWYLNKSDGGIIAGTYIHGIFENDLWRNDYLNLIRIKKGLKISDKEIKPYKIKQDAIINNLATQFKKYINISPLLN